MLFGGFYYRRQGVDYGSCPKPHQLQHSTCCNPNMASAPSSKKKRGIQYRIFDLGIGQLADQLTPKWKLLELRYIYSYHLSVLGSFGSQFLEFL